ncbi:MAG: hypothetical protein NTU78_16060, partial [Alphaproteobacteria bacterium]|nr:hypothetical protein [Alphaproteobacteria bacterium]
GQITSSMDPHDVVFRILPRKREGRDSPTEPWAWHLRPPSAFVTREFGTNGVVQRSSVRGDGFWVDIQAIVSPDNKTLTPTAGQPPEKQVVRSIIMHLSNSSALGSIRKIEGSCVPQHLKGTILGARGDKVWRDEPCYDQRLRCRISMDADGWRVDLAATKDLYADPENVCRLARNFLDTYTVRRDRIP